MIKDVKVTIPHSNSHIPILNGKLYPIWYRYDFQDYIPILTSQWFRFRWVFGLFFFANPSGFPVFMRQPLSRRWFCQAVKKQNWYVSNVSTYLYCILIYIYIYAYHYFYTYKIFGIYYISILQFTYMAEGLIFFLSQRIWLPGDGDHSASVPAASPRWLRVNMSEWLDPKIHFGILRAAVAILIQDSFSILMWSFLLVQGNRFRNSNPFCQPGQCVAMHGFGLFGRPHLWSQRIRGFYPHFV